MSIKDNLDKKDSENISEEEKQKELSSEELFTELLNFKEELKQAEEREEHLKQQFLRLQADYKNYQNRVLKEREDARYFEVKTFIEKLLPVLDNFDRAIETGKSNKSYDKFFEGIEMIRQQLRDVLEGNGLKRIDCIKQQFDPTIHQAVMQCEVKDEEDNIVLEEVQTGYLYRDKLIRPAMVKVSKKC